MENKPSNPSDQTSLPSNLLVDIRTIVTQARGQVTQTVNSAMVLAYWQIGQLIIEQEQQGNTRAEYGKAQLKALSVQLSAEFGKGFDVTNLRNMRQFYRAFPIRDSLRLELSWTHYRTLIRIDNKPARLWYMNEAQQQAWSARALERQIGTLYYECLLASQDKMPVKTEAHAKTNPLATTPKDYLRDPYILDFLNLQYPNWGLTPYPHRQMQQAQVLDNPIYQNVEVLGYEE